MNTKTIINLDNIISTIENKIQKLMYRKSFESLKEYADDTAATTAGLKSGDFYIVTSTKLIKQIA